jgi:hypothetical protein
MALTLVMRWPWRLFPLGYDESVWGFIAQQTLKGGFVPYRDVIDNKPPLVYVPFFLSEIFVGHGDRAVRATGVGLHVLIVGLLVWVLCLALGPLAAAAAGAVEAVLGGTPLLEGNYLLQSEIQIEVILLLLLYYSRRVEHDSGPGRRVPAGPALMGVLCAAAFLMKQTHLCLAPPFCALAVVPVPAGRRLRTAIVFASGFAVSVLACAAPFAAARSLPDLLDGVVWYNTCHVVAVPTWSAFFARLRDVFSGQVPLVLASLAGGVLALFPERTRRMSIASWLFLFAGTVGVVAGGDRLFRHYFLLLSFPLRLLLACGVAALPRWPGRIAAAAVLLFVALRIPGERRWPAEILRVTPVPIDPEPLVFLAEHRKPAEAVFFEWQPYYYETGLRAPHRYITTDHLGTPGYETERDNVLRALGTSSPAWIVTRRGTAAREWGLAGLVATRYEKAYEWSRGAIFRLLPRDTSQLDRLRPHSRPARSDENHFGPTMDQDVGAESNGEALVTVAPPVPPMNHR